MANTTQDEILYNGHKINTYNTVRVLKVKGEYVSVETKMYSCDTDGYTSQSLDAVEHHIDTYLNKDKK